MIITDFKPLHFLQEYWQKKPCLIKQFVPNFDDPIDEHDLAGLAQEHNVDSRVVGYHQDRWQVSQGPFETFDDVCKGDWSLLVQGVDRYIAEVSELSQLTDFIGNWRFDDVMVSFSMPNAGVGPHIDQYDVFIIQGKGKRRWQVGLPCHSKTVMPHPLLKQIKGFEPIIDEILEPGDAIYIPPKHPHNGVAIEPCLNYSIGFRAPTNLEALTGLLDESDAITQVQQRYTDPNLHQLRALSTLAENVSEQELARVKANIIELLNSPQAESALLQYLSRQSLPEILPITEHDFDSVQTGVENFAVFEILPGVKPIYREQQSQIFTFYIDGNMFETSILLMNAIKTFLSEKYCQGYPADICDADMQNNWVKLLTQLLNANLIELVDEQVDD